MIKPSSLSIEATTYIRAKLDALAAREKVRIVFAIESGSRAWGFPSTDSDYDVRFVYARLKADYLSVRTFRDVIETPLEDDDILGVPLDLNGWDIRKALRLGLHSNPVLLEWLVSPIRYCGNDGEIEAIKGFFSQAATREALQYHYDRTARRAWEEILPHPDKVKVKLYCYALRPALVLHWLATRDDLPPMDVAGLSDGLPASLVSAMAHLFTLKETCAESDQVARNPVFDDFIGGILSTKAPRPAIIETNPALIETGDRLIADIVG